MSRRNSTLWHITRTQAEQVADEWALRHVKPAWDGDVDAAGSLKVALSNSRRGYVAVLMWNGKVPLPAFREYLRGAWGHDHREVIEAAGSRRWLQAMFRYAAFPRPDWFGPTVRVYRGVHGVDLAEARQGYAWTLDADVACWFACRGRTGREPLVVVADVPAESIAMFTDERDEKECVLTVAPKSAAVYADPREWRSGFDRVESKRVAERKALLAQWAKGAPAVAAE